MSAGAEPRGETPFADRIVGELLPADLEWERLVRSYPLPSLALAAVAGYILGRRHGEALLRSFATLASDQVERSVDRLVKV